MNRRLVVGICCAVGLGGLILLVVTMGSDAPRAATHAFVAELAESDADGAYDKLCAGTQARFTRDEFRRYLQSQPVPTGAKVRGFEIEGDLAEIRTVLDLRGGGTRSHVFELVDESGGWKVCGDPY